MPELPEVQTTVSGISALLERFPALIITDVWTDYNSMHFKGSDTIKDPQYFTYFKKTVIGKQLASTSRRAKNILIHLDPGHHSILIHLKMTGHVMFGEYEFKKGVKKDPWKLVMKTGPLADPFNRHIRLVFELSQKMGKENTIVGHLVLSDMRRFAKVTLIDQVKDNVHSEESSVVSEHLRDLGPEPLEDDFTFDVFVDRLTLKPRGKIKPTIMDQTVIAGVGNIYADESLWRAGIHPESVISKIPRTASRGQPSLKLLYEAIRTTLSRGIDFGGDSMSDYRNIHGERGTFQETHRAYRKTGSRCTKPGCRGIIVRKVIAGRSGHFCDTHQKKFI